MNFEFSNKDRNFLLERVGCIEQLAHIRQSVLEDGRGRGTRIAEFANGSGLNFLNAVNVSSGTLADARLSANVALLNGNQTFTGTNIFSGNLVAASLFKFARTTNAPVAGGTITPSGSFILLNPASAVILNTTNSIADLSDGIGTILILQGASDLNTVQINDGSNTTLGGNRILGINDTLTMIYDGVKWVELSFANN